MTTAGTRDLAIVALVAVAPIVIVLLFAILRGYTVTIHFHRPGKDEERR